jgi:hypothetical protein
MTEVTAQDMRGYLLVCEDVYDSKHDVYQHVLDGYGCIRGSICCYERYFVVAGYHLPLGKWRVVVGIFERGRRSSATDVTIERVRSVFLRVGQIRMVDADQFEDSALVALNMNDWKDHSCRVCYSGKDYVLASLGDVCEPQVRQYLKDVEAAGNAACEI